MLRVSSAAAAAAALSLLSRRRRLASLPLNRDRQLTCDRDGTGNSNNDSAQEGFHDGHILQPVNRYRRVVVAGALTVAVACVGKAPEPLLQSPSTIKDIMDSMVEPSADFIFDSVAQIADEHGITEKAPHTDEEWKEVRRRAVQLLEAPNLLVMSGRKAALPHERSQNPQIELQPEEIQKLIDADHPAFSARALKLQDAADDALRAIDARNAKALFDAAGRLDKACESCHLYYWYPNDERAQKAFKEHP